MQGGFLSPAQGKDRRSGSGDPKAKGTCLKGCLPQVLKPRDQQGAQGFNNTIFQRPADQAVVFGEEAGYQATHIAPLPYTLFPG